MSRIVSSGAELPTQEDANSPHNIAVDGNTLQLDGRYDFVTVYVMSHTQNIGEAVYMRINGQTGTSYYYTGQDGSSYNSAIGWKLALNTATARGSITITGKSGYDVINAHSSMLDKSTDIATHCRESNATLPITQISFINSNQNAITDDITVEVRGKNV
jgi:hypothetical protein